MRSVRARLPLVLAALFVYPLAGYSDDDLAGAINERINESVNGVIAFSAQETVSSGFFSLKSSNPRNSDEDIEVLHVPLKLDFGQTEDRFRPQLRALIGRFQDTQSVGALDGVGEDDFDRLSAVTVAAGGGVAIRVWDELRVTPLFRVAYTRLKNEYDFNNPYSQQHLAAFDKLLLNITADIMTYSGALETDYSWKIGGATIKPKFRYAYLFNNSTNTSSPLIDINSSTTILQGFLDLRYPLNTCIWGQPLGVHPFLIFTDLHGKARAVEGLNSFWEVGAELYADSSGVIPLVREFSLGVSYVFGEDLSGYRLGVGAEF